MRNYLKKQFLYRKFKLNNNHSRHNLSEKNVVDCHGILGQLLDTLVKFSSPLALVKSMCVFRGQFFWHLFPFACIIGHFIEYLNIRCRKSINLWTKIIRRKFSVIWFDFIIRLKGKWQIYWRFHAILVELDSFRFHSYFN